MARAPFADSCCRLSASRGKLIPSRRLIRSCHDEAAASSLLMKSAYCCGDIICDLAQTSMGENSTHERSRVAKGRRIMGAIVVRKYECHKENVRSPAPFTRRSVRNGG